MESVNKAFAKSQNHEADIDMCLQKDACLDSARGHFLTLSVCIFQSVTLHGLPIPEAKQMGEGERKMGKKKTKAHENITARLT